MSTAPSAAPPCPVTDYEAACTPSRKGVPAPGAKLKGKAAQVSRERPDYVSPEPTTYSDRQAWDRMWTRMNSFHNHFRSEFQRMWTMAEAAQEGGGSRLSEYIMMCSAFEQHIEMHHSIEEQYIFPILAKKMPMFGDDHLEEHKAIHAGLDKFSAYLKKVRSKPSSFSAEDFHAILASFGPILFYHLDAEVGNLKPENLRRYYTLAEVKALPM